jgi:Armadillo/beta-catenin-like repeat
VCVDPENQAYILHHQGVAKLRPLLKSDNQEIVCNAITTLISLKTENSVKGYKKFN